MVVACGGLGAQSASPLGELPSHVHPVLQACAAVLVGPWTDMWGWASHLALKAMCPSSEHTEFPQRMGSFSFHHICSLSCMSWGLLLLREAACF